MKTFLEIGVADFDTLIPLAKKGGWMGYCVEPMPHHCETLRGMAADLPVAICPHAISDLDGTVEMLVGNRKEEWAVGANHVISANHMGAKVLELEQNDFLRDGTLTVDCMTLDSFIDKHQITEIDFCKIDVEGHEINVLKDYSWKVKPKFMKVEHKHLRQNFLDLILQGQGYTLFIEEEDIYAVL